MESISCEFQVDEIARLQLSQGAMTDGIVTFDSESDHIASDLPDRRS